MESYGKGAKAKDVTEISHLVSNAVKYADKTVTVEGTVVDVCAKRGCWMKLAPKKGFETVRIKVRDGVMVFPMSARGKRAIARGILKVSKLSKERTVSYMAHLSEERGQKFDPKSVKEGMTIYQINADGAVIY